MWGLIICFGYSVLGKMSLLLLLLLLPLHLLPPIPLLLPPRRLVVLYDLIPVILLGLDITIVLPILSIISRLQVVGFLFLPTLTFHALLLIIILQLDLTELVQLELALGVLVSVGVVVIVIVVDVVDVAGVDVPTKVPQLTFLKVAIGPAHGL